LVDRHIGGVLLVIKHFTAYTDAAQLHHARVRFVVIFLATGHDSQTSNYQEQSQCFHGQY
jgi:hypothetical protein